MTGHGVRSVGGLRLPAHRATSATLAGAYPSCLPTVLRDLFNLGGLPLLGCPPPSCGIPIGVEVVGGSRFFYDPWTLYQEGWLTNPNVLLAGVIGQGKSALAKSLAVRSIAAGRKVYVAGDPKGEWVPVAQAVGGVVVALGPGLRTRLNPLEPDSRTSSEGSKERQLRLLSALAQQALGRALRPVEHTALDEAITEANRRRTMTLPTVVEALLERSEQRQPGASAAAAARESRDIAHALRRLVHGDLAGMFDGPSTVTLDRAAPMVVLDLSRLTSNEDAVAVAMTCGAAWLETAIAAAPTQRWVIYDEAWRLLRSLALVRQMQAQWKLSRSLGVANLLVLHRLSDLDAAGGAGTEIRSVAGGLLADCSTRIIYRQESDQLDDAGRALGLTRPERDLVPLLQRGTGLWKLPGRSYLVRHDLHADELRVYDTDAAMRDLPLAGGS